MNFKPLLTPYVAALTLLMTPGSVFADHKAKVYRDLDGDGHYNKKTYESHHHHSDYYRSSPYYGGYYGYRSPYYGYSRGYYGYPRTGIGLSIFSRPTVYTSRYYRSSGYSNSLAADVQSALRRRGYYHGSIDGDIGPGSRAAIRAYQREHGLSATGRIDSSLLRSLRID